MKLMYEAFDEVDWSKVTKDLERVFVPLKEHFARAAKAMSATMTLWFPVVSEAHRVEVKRVHSAYRAKQGRRKKRR